MPAPEPHADGVLQVRILLGGAAEGALQARLIRARIERAINQLPVATLEFDDGDVASQDFPLARRPDMAPGTAITLEVGHGDAPQRLFQGVIATIGLTIGAHGARLVLQCHDRAGALAQGLRNTSHAGLADADILRALIEAHGLRAEVQGVYGQQEQRSQIQSSDWAFVLAVAQANGCVVRVQDGSVQVAPAATGEAPALSVVYGSSMMALDAHLGPAAPGAAAPLRGSVHFEGNARATVGACIELAGLGERFSGPVCIAGLTHTLDAGGWITQARFDAAESPASRPVPGIQGLQLGTVLASQGDPQGQHRVQVRLPAAGVDAVWARLAQAQAGTGFGTLFLPEPGDEVVVGFFDGDAQHPVVLGSLYSSQRLPPGPLRGDGPSTAIVTHGGSRLEFDDGDHRVTVTTPAGNRLVFSDQERSIELTDQHGNGLVLSAAGLLLDSRGDIRLSAQGHIAVQAAGGIDLDAGADLNMAGLNVHCSAAVGLVVQGKASAALSAEGQTTVKGALVMIN